MNFPRVVPANSRIIQAAMGWLFICGSYISLRGYVAIGPLYVYFITAR